MSPAVLIYAAIVVAVPMVLGGLVLVAFGGRIEAHRRASRRLSGIERARARPEAIEALRKEMGAGLPGARPALASAIETRLARAGVKAAPSRLLVIAAAVAGAAFAALTTLTRTSPATALTLSAALGVGAVHMWLAGRIKARGAAIEEALPDAVELMVRSLRVGHPFGTAVQIVAREVPGPLGEEMAVVAEEASYGRDIGEALTEMAERVGLQDLRFLAVAVTIQRQSGGNLAEVLEGLAQVVRARFRLFRRVKAITAEAKFSGFFLSGFPVVAGLGINLLKPDYYDAVRETAYFAPAAALVGAFLVGNILVMRRLVDIKV